MVAHGRTDLAIPRGPRVVPAPSSQGGRLPAFSFVSRPATAPVHAPAPRGAARRPTLGSTMAPTYSDPPRCISRRRVRIAAGSSPARGANLFANLQNALLSHHRPRLRGAVRPVASSQSTEVFVRLGDRCRRGAARPIAFTQQGELMCASSARRISTLSPTSPSSRICTVGLRPGALRRSTSLGGAGRPRTARAAPGRSCGRGR